jgi:glycosyltransferase involved in cell wall biosynthesis
VTLSVALATYNGEQFLGAQLGSLASQSVRPHQLVVCDDGSTDGTMELLRRFRAEAPFAVEIHANAGRLGFADAFLRCASLCSGRWIAFCDQDDLWAEHKIERCTEELQRSDVLLTIHSSRVVDADASATRRMFPHIRRDHVDEPLTGDPWLAVRGMSMAFAAELLRVVDPAQRPISHYADGRMNHDEWVYVLARGLGRISFVADALAMYRQHAGNVAGAADSATVRDALRTGGTYYARRREQADALAVIFAGIAERDAARRERAVRAADWYRAQAAGLEQRLSVYDSDAPAHVRFRRLVGLARAGAYRGRTRSLVRDAAMIALRRTG